MIDVENVRFTYPNAREETLHGLTFGVGEGEIFGFLGPSGAGKSTSQKLLIGLLKQYEGSARVFGTEVGVWDNELYERIGVSFEFPNHFLKLTARENLEYFGSLYRAEGHAPEAVLEWVALAEAADQRVGEFSKGMKARLSVARAILHKPTLLFLDEPTSGLDPVNARRIKELILHLRDEGTTTFLTTHNMVVADELCDRVGFIVEGTIAVVENPGTLKKRYGSDTVSVEYRGTRDEVNREVFPLQGLGDNAEFLSVLRGARRIERIHSSETTLEQVFIEVTGRGLGTA